MGKGGPLAFLNKKPWHPGNIQNQEEIWKREQAFLAEVEKREELKRQIEEEREAEDNATQFQRETCALAEVMPSCVCLRYVLCVAPRQVAVHADLGSSVWSGCTREALRHGRTQKRRKRNI